MGIGHYLIIAAILLGSCGCVVVAVRVLNGQPAFTWRQQPIPPREGRWRVGPERRVPGIYMFNGPELLSTHVDKGPADIRDGRIS